MTVSDKFKYLWNHAAGPKTIFFWAPLTKWVIVIAGLSDLTRPAETISVQQAISLFVTGIIWSRYAMVIIPRNFIMLSANSTVAVIQSYQIFRHISAKSHKTNEK